VSSFAPTPTAIIEIESKNKVQPTGACAFFFAQNMSRKPRPRRHPPASRPGSAQKSSTQKSPAQFSSAQTASHRELTTKRRGELAELAFTLKATALGFTVSRPYGESNRYDFIVDFCGKNPCAGPDPAESHNLDSHHPNSSGNSAAGKTPNCKTVLDTTAKTATVNTATPRTATPNPTTRKHTRKNPSLRQTIANLAAQLPHPPTSLWRVQVKCSTQIMDGLYRVNAHRRINGRAVPYLPSEIDFFAVYIIPEDTWYIIPLLATRGRTSLLFRRKADPRPGLYDPYREAWPLLHPRM
jgi:PD-(D/E)XK endonuclease